MDRSLKTIGLIGGLSPQSTTTYYATIQRLAVERLGPRHAVPLLLHSVPFHEFHALKTAGRWQDAGQRLVDVARGLEAHGADVIVLATNTMHKVADPIEAATDIPFLHIVDVTAAAIKVAGIDSVGLLGTEFTLRESFYVERLAAAGIETVLPQGDDVDEVNRIIFDELVAGQIDDESRRSYIRIVDEMVERGARGVILGCTEIGMLIGPDDVSVPTFDTADLHAEAAFAFAVGAED